MRAAIDVAPVAGRSDLAAFIQLPKRLYRGQKGYVAPLDMERAEALSPKTNPFFDHAEVRLFLARRDGKVVGRISAQIDKLHQQKYGDGTGHFGFLDAEDDPAVFAALIAAAEDWLKSKGVVHAVGPLSFSTNEEIGALIEGFDALPMLLMPFHLPYTARHIEAEGYAKTKDVIAYHLHKDEYKPLGSKRMLERAADESGVIVRNIDMKRFQAEIETVIDIFNDAWAENWGMVPFTEKEMAAAAKGLKLLIDPKMVVIAEQNGEAAGMMVCLPNLLEAARDLDGRLLPFGLPKLLYRLKTNKVRSGRIPLMGIRRKHHGTILGATLLPLMFEKLRVRFLERNLERLEMSWILEDNTAMRRVLEGIGGKAYKTHRIYEKALA
ncbi:dATP pyrophosphohydrolase [Dongia sedimenti]|uniref:dATP pyrophosphohydrolase n=1 Tax=Dongia sedimenti TaxID=3064282 RepID=A0ABU0YJQ8_9PROT|nr:dATP pyrophosphohydrolase [Rhodospirillaceae bacterium R-7]